MFAKSSHQHYLTNGLSKYALDRPGKNEKREKRTMFSWIAEVIRFQILGYYFDCESGLLIRRE